LNDFDEKYSIYSNPTALLNNLLPSREQILELFASIFQERNAKNIFKKKIQFQLVRKSRGKKTRYKFIIAYDGFFSAWARTRTISFEL